MITFENEAITKWSGHLFWDDDALFARLSGAWASGSSIFFESGTIVQDGKC